MKVDNLIEILKGKEESLLKSNKNIYMCCVQGWYSKQELKTIQDSIKGVNLVISDNKKDVWRDCVKLTYFRLSKGEKEK